VSTKLPPPKKPAKSQSSSCKFKFPLPLGASSSAALVLVLVGQAFKPGGNLLLGLNQDVQQIFGYVAVFVVKERRGQT